MLSFFTKHKKVRGVITVFLTLIYLSTYLLIGIFVDGGRVRMAGTVIEDAQQIAVENVMSQYNRGLYEYYGLFGISDYNVDSITKDVKTQIEETVGLKVPEDTVKDFILDVATGVDSFSKNFNIIEKGENKVVAAKEFFNKIGNDINESHKQFDPYGIDIKSVSASYIDLTNIDVMRAQMRDEMRYTAPLVLGANFLSCLSELISMGDAADAVSKSADIIKKSESSGEKELKEFVYLESLNSFSDKFHGFVVDSYNLEGNLGAIKWGIQEKAASTIRSFENAKRLAEDVSSRTQANFAKEHPFLGMFFGGIKSIAERVTEVMNPGPKFVSQVYEETKHYITRTDQTGLEDLISTNESELTRFYDAFDDDPWPDGSEKPYTREVQVGVDSDGDPVYEKRYFYHEHKAAINELVDRKTSTYKSKINALIVSCNNAISGIDNAMNEIDNYMNHIDSIQGKFIAEIKNNENISNKARNIFEQNMGIYLRQWDNLSKEKEVLDNINNDLEELKNFLNNALTHVDEVARAIKNESVNQGWSSPSHHLNSKRVSDKRSFHSTMEGLAKNDKKIKEFQEIAKGDAQANSIIDLINDALAYKEGVGESLVKENKFGGISKHKDGKEVPNPYIALADDKEGEALSMTSKFTIFNVVDKVKEIMDLATNFAKKLPEAVFNNLYDEAYILSHCRDYVHTYRFKELHYDNKTDAELKEIENAKHIDIDTVLNGKFVNDKSDTNYLSNKRLEDLEVTPAEIEYIIFGFTDDSENGDSYANVIAMYTSIFIIRLALNYIAAISSPTSNAEITELAASTTVFAPIVYFAAPLIYAIPQSIVETKQIMYDCEKTNLWNASATLGLYDGFDNLKDEVFETLEDITKNEIKELKDTSNDIKDKADTNAESLAPIKQVAQAVLDNEDSDNYQNVRDSAWRLIYDSATTSSESDGGTSSTGESSSTSVGGGGSSTSGTGSSTGVMLDDGDDISIKAGYSDYLLIGLFILGIGKKRQISNLQDVIEANMAKGQPGFELRNTYSQISVETESSIKYIFMTQSFMGRTFSNAKGYKAHTLKTKTAFAY